MQRKNCWCVEIVLVVFGFFLVLPFVSAVRINEVMPHTNNSLGNEWIELYNDENNNITLSEWKIGDRASNDTISLNISAYGFGMIVDSSINCSLLNVTNESCVMLTTIGSGLNDDDENIYLYDNSSVIKSSFSYNASIKSSGTSWQFYNFSWYSCAPTPASGNFCNLTNQSTQQIQTNTTTSQAEAAIYLKLVYDEIRNGKEFEIKIRAYNLKDKEYEAKVYVALENEDIISEIYNEQEGRWKSSIYYLNFSKGEGNRSKSFKMNITKNYEGKAYIKVRIREFEKDNIIIEKSEEIEIFKREVNENASSVITRQLQTNSTIINITDTGIIKLNSKDIKSQNISENKTYRTKTQYMKEYGIYLFAGFCVFVIVILIIKRL